MKSDYLTRFVKQECANYNRHLQACLDDELCKILAGKRCGYFGKAVLGRPDYKFKLPHWDYTKLFAEYDDLTGRVSETVTQRLCGCGTNLMPRQRVCADCSKKRRKTAYRKINRKRVG